MPASSTTPIRRTSTTPGRCSSWTTAGSATTWRPATEAPAAIVGGRLRAHLTVTPHEAGPSPGGPLGAAAPGFGTAAAGLAGGLRDLLDERLFERTTLAQAGAGLGASPSHLVRSFTGTFGIAPHQYVTARRIDAARRRLLDGEPIALVAATVGFYDQAHFSRQFKRHVGTPPGRYARSAMS
jgi:AraC-like DNA-binding protein